MRQKSDHYGRAIALESTRLTEQSIAAQMIDYAISFVSDNADTLIALSALVVAAQQGMISRKHARLSVHPHLTLDSQCQNVPPQVQILLRNDGIGPAFIESFDVTFDGEVVSTSSSEDTLWIDLGRELGLPFTWGGGSVLKSGEAIRPTSSQVLAKWCTNQDDKDETFSNELANSELARIEIRISYRSAYGERHVSHFRKDRAFANEQLRQP